jgi:hypothetical protein
MRNLAALLALVLCSMFPACGGSDEGAGSDTAGPADDVAVDGISDVVPDPDRDAAPDPGPADDAATDPAQPDAPPDDVPADGSTAPDGTSVDAAPPLDGRACNVFPSDPVTDDWTTSVGYARHLDEGQPHLTGAYATVYNCLPKSSGGGGGYELCTPEQTVVPGDDGTYLHVVPPASDTAFDDAFAEVQMYVHMNEVHDYFATRHGLTSLDFPLLGLVNLSMKQYGQWMPFDNAAFMPAETMSAMGLDFGLDRDAIVFGQGTFVDFSYDATVIYHEYTHAVIGDQRLYGYTADVYGLNPEPMGMSEGTADYFAATLIDNSRIGAYALDMPMMGDLSRDLSEFHKCPDDLVGESHADGRMWASALWAIRVALGAEIADSIIFTALMNAGMDTTFHEASNLLLDAAEAHVTATGTSTAVRDLVQAALAEHGVDACQRVKPFKNLTSVPYDKPLRVLGTMTSMVNEFQASKIVPMAFQYVAAVPEGTAAVRLDFKARISDEMAQYYQGPAEPKVAFRVGQAVAYSYAGGKMQMAADALLTPTSTGTGNNKKWSITLAGNCAKAGDLYVHFLNESYVDIQLDAMSLTWLQDATDLPLNFDVCQ